MRKFSLFSICVFLPYAFASTPAARRFSDALMDFRRSPEFSASESALRAIEFDFGTRELVLQPQLELTGKRTNERRQFLNSLSALRVRADNFTASLSKPFSTGTTLKIAPSLEKAHTPSLAISEPATFDWQVSMSQSLWQDAFGRATRLRRSREGFERRQQLASVWLSQAQLLVEFENLYWDWAMALRERELRARNVARGEELLRWVRGRYARSAAENTDVLQAEALLGKRRLDLTTVDQALGVMAARMERYLPNVNWRPDVEELARPRDPETLLAPWNVDEPGEERKLEFLAAQNQALAAGRRADEVRESIQPTLELQLGYGKNAIDADGGKALSESLDNRRENSSVGLVFRSGLDWGLERGKVEAARAARDAAEARRQALEAEARVAWKQLKRNVSDFQARIAQARALADLQGKKADAERRRYRLGRSTAFQAISFEQDATDAEITLWNLCAQARKMEAQARLFAR